MLALAGNHVVCNSNCLLQVMEVTEDIDR